MNDECVSTNKLDFGTVVPAVFFFMSVFLPCDCCIEPAVFVFIRSYKNTQSALIFFSSFLFFLYISFSLHIFVRYLFISIFIRLSQVFCIWSIAMPTLHPSQFFIYRPDGTKTALVPVDELPSWIWIHGLTGVDWGRDKNMVLATPGSIPKDIEYDAVCCNRYYTGNQANERVSENNQPMGPFPAAAASELPSAKKPNAAGPLNGLCLPLIQPPLLDTRVQNPMVGMCLVDCEWTLGRFSSCLPPSKPSSPSRSGSDSAGSSLNPEAPEFSPSGHPAEYARLDLTGIGEIKNEYKLYCVAKSLPSESQQSSRRCSSPVPCNVTTPQMPPSPPLTATTSESGGLSSADVEQVEKATTADSDESDGCSSSELDNLLSRRPGHRKAHRGPLNKKSKRFRRVRRVKAKRGTRKVLFPNYRSQQENSATKRQERREKLERKKHQGRGRLQGRFWHKMLPTWRAGGGLRLR